MIFRLFGLPYYHVIIIIQLFHSYFLQAAHVMRTDTLTKIVYVSPLEWPTGRRLFQRLASRIGARNLRVRIAAYRVSVCARIYVHFAYGERACRLLIYVCK